MEDAEIEALVARTRAALEPLWAEFHAERDRTALSLGRTPSARHPAAGMCRLTSAVLSDVLSAATGDVWSVAGGETWNGVPGGMRDVEGVLRGHYWVRSGRTIVDATADQFGYEPVLVTASDDPRYVANYTRRELSSHLRDVRFTKKTWTRTLAATCAEVPAPRF